MRGSTIIKEFLSPAEHDVLVDYIDGQTWSSALARRTQQYGFKYLYTGGVPIVTTPIPHEFEQMMGRLDPYFDKTPDQVIVSEYIPGKGISPHIDSVHHFGSVIATVSLLDTWTMQFSKRDPAEACFVPLYARSAIILKDDSRYVWRHSITTRRSDYDAGKYVPRKRRISVTFRTMNV